MHARSAVSKEVRAVRAAPSNASVSDANCWFSAWLSAMAGPPAKGSDVMQKILESLTRLHHLAIWRNLRGAAAFSFT
ncbi:MAG: hypothetical protein DMG01_23515 [Acidobacteria bacterium]|nr:MAG: hypothetical protein DMG01_23515 [Acidobacteriota bacterium]